MPKKTQAENVRLVLKVPPRFHHELKIYAAVYQLTMSEVVQRGFELLKKAEK
jgi:hypothetical protein